MSGYFGGELRSFDRKLRGTSLGPAREDKLYIWANYIHIESWGGGAAELKHTSTQAQVLNKWLSSEVEWNKEDKATPLVPARGAVCVGRGERELNEPNPTYL